MSDPDTFVAYASRDIRLTSDGSALIFRIWPGAPPASAADPLEQDDILPWLEKGLPRSNALINVLLDSLNNMRRTVHVSAALSYDPVAEANAAIQVLRAQLPLMIQHAAINGKGSLATNLKHYLAETLRAETFIPAPVLGDHKAEPWHDDAMWLLFALRHAAAPAKVKVSSAGPASRFLQKALHSIWGEQFSGSAICKAVERYDHGIIPEMRFG